MEKETRNRIQQATQAARQLLEQEYSAQLEGVFDILLDGTISPDPGDHLSESQRIVRGKLVAAVAHKRSAGTTSAEAVEAYLREAAFTMLNRFVALKMLEARGLVQDCVSLAEESNGFREFAALAPGFGTIADKGYRLYVESIFDELSREVGILFDRRDIASLLWPRRQALLELVGVLNDPELASVWGEDETIGWVYQYFNSDDERRQMRAESQAPRNSRELAVRNQFFTPRYVVEFLTDNTLGRTWWQMTAGRTVLTERCRYLVTDAEPGPPRTKKDPRDVKVLDPACGSGHFLLYAFDLLLTIYEEAWSDDEAGITSHTSGRSLREDFSELAALRRSAPALILEHNLYGVDIDPRASQIAALTLWLRAQRAYSEEGIAANERPAIAGTHIVVAEPMPGDQTMVREFAKTLRPPLLGTLFELMVAEMEVAGEFGSLLRVDEGIAAELEQARLQFVEQGQSTGYLPGMDLTPRQDELDFSGINDTQFFHQAEGLIIEALRQFADSTEAGGDLRRRLFAGDSAQGIAFVDLARTRFDVVLMNPPFGACSLGVKKRFEQSYPRTKNDLYAAFVERGVEMLNPGGMLGAITSRTGFFLSSFQKWREEILLKEAPPVVFADLGFGVLDSAMVEVAAYCLERAGSRGPEDSGAPGEAAR